MAPAAARPRTTVVTPASTNFPLRDIIIVIRLLIHRRRDLGFVRSGPWQRLGRRRLGNWNAAGRRFPSPAGLVALWVMSTNEGDGQLGRSRMRVRDESQDKSRRA